MAGYGRGGAWGTAWVARRFGAALIAGAAAAIVLPACSSSRETVQNSPTADYDKLYQRREYAKAYQAASAAYGKAGSTYERERAALTAGLAAAALEPPKEADALHWLNPLVQSTDNRIAGTASATLGMIEHNKGRHTQALNLLTAAADKLTGNDQARAAMFAGDSLQALGRTADARAMYDRGAGAATDKLLAQQIEAKRQTVANDGVRAAGAFTLQVGSFAEINTANGVATKLRPKAVAGGLPPPRVIAINSDGKTLYAVRIGRYATRADAEVAQDKLRGEKTVIRVATGE